jgi:mono/diheme cytochrome c family protein
VTAVRARVAVCVLAALGAAGVVRLAFASGGTESPRAPSAATAPTAAAPDAARTTPAPGVADARRAKNNYLIHCMGCHGETGVGFQPNVPSMRGPMAKFARTDEGRAYLMRIPGVTQSSLSAEAVAEVLNWSLHEFNTAEDVAGIRPFTTEEIATARQQPLLEVVETRAKLAAQY